MLTIKHVKFLLVVNVYVILLCKQTSALQPFVNMVVIQKVKHIDDREKEHLLGYKFFDQYGLLVL